MKVDDDKGPPSSSFVKKGDRQLFTVELRPNETTVVSWKKLMKDANLDSTLLPQQTSIPEQHTRQTDRLRALMEKIERLYMGWGKGKDSSDEEDQLDIHDDQYDTQDSFIDDSELDDYFEVDNMAIQNDGFFVKKTGELKIINTPPMLPGQPAKKRHQKDMSKNPIQNFDGNVSRKNVNVENFACGKIEYLPMKSEDVHSYMLKSPADACVSNRNEKVDKFDIEKNSFLLVKTEVDGHVSDKNVKVGKSTAENIAFLPVKCEDVDDNMSKNHSKNVDGHVSCKHIKMSQSAARKTTFLSVKSEVDSSHNLAIPSENYEDLNSQSQFIASGRTPSSIGNLEKFEKHAQDIHLSAKQEKEDRFHQIKKEIIEMIKMQAPSMESMQQQQAGTSVDQECGPDGKATTKGNFYMDATLDDKICDLYDIFVEGLEECSVPQIRKWYVELAQLWPNGCMDNHGVKSAICRAKQRRRELCNKQTEQMKRKKLSTTQQEENASSTALLHNMREQLPPESSSSNTGIALQAVHPSVNAKKQEKAKGKRKAEYEHDGTRFRPIKLT